MSGSYQKYTSAFLAISILASSAASAAPQTIDPLVALSVLGTPESRAAVCASGAPGSAVGGTAVVAETETGEGCVLPTMDAAPPTQAISTASSAVDAAAAPATPAAGIAALPLLLGLAAIATVAAVLIKTTDGDGEINLPISP